MSGYFDGDTARDLRLAHPLNEPRALCAALGLGVERGDWSAQTNGLTVRCPRHNGLSCSVTLGRDSTVRVRCFGCDFTGDALSLIAEVHGLHRNFRELIRVAGELTGHHGFAPERGFARPKTLPVRRPIAVQPERDYPPASELNDLLQLAGHVSDDAQAQNLLQTRGLNPEWIDDFHLARVLPANCALPRWARFKGRPWNETGHRLVLPVVDATGAVRSVRAWRIGESDAPKRLPPCGYRASGLVLACGSAQAMLAGVVEGFPQPLRIVVTEGEPNFLTWATRFSDADEDAPLVIGIFAGAWSSDFAARIPAGASVTIRTDHDLAGDRYADQVARGLSSHCTVLRSRIAFGGAL